MYNADNDYFNHSAAKLTLGEKQLKDTTQYTTNSIKTESGINLTITIKAQLNRHWYWYTYLFG